jgi:hypothetical protein
MYHQKGISIKIREKNPDPYANVRDPEHWFEKHEKN